MYVVKLTAVTLLLCNSGRETSGKMCGGCVVTYSHHLGACQEVMDRVAESGVCSQGPWLSDEL